MLTEVASHHGLTRPDFIRVVLGRELIAAGAEIDLDTLVFPRGQHEPTGTSRRGTLERATAEALGVAIRRKGLSLGEAARRAGIDRSYLYRLTKGTRRPSTVVTERLIQALNLDADLAEQLRLGAAPRSPNRVVA
jgi:hypothetical protein